MSSAKPKPPKGLTKRTPEQRILRQKIWKRCNVDNEHFMAAIVGREGSGKSYTGLKFGEAVDPTFNASRVMFDPASFLERLKEWKAKGETKGKFVMADEAGVGVGVRTWYDREQILFNQVLQVIRDENMAIVFTLPRLNELDSQARGRLHAFIEMTDKEAGEWAEFKWLNWDPTRDERDKTYRKYPRMRVNGQQRPVKRLRISPPSEELVKGYEERKDAFQKELYDEALDEMGDAEDEEMTVKDIADEILDNGIDDYVSIHNQTKTPYVNKELIRASYEIPHRDAKAVKSFIEKQIDTTELKAVA